MCGMLEVSRQGYYAWKKRAPSARQKEDVTLTTLIVAITRRIRAGTASTDSRGPGSERVPGQLEAGAAPGPGRWPAMRAPAAVQGDDGAGSGERLRPGRLVCRDFVPGAKDQLWFGDITYIFTMSGWAYLATVIDGYSRKVVGWSVADHMREELVIDAFRMAVANRRPGTGEVVFHSDRGSQYTGRAFRDVCLGNGMIRRSGRPEYASTMRWRSRGTRRSRKSSSTCMHGRTSSTLGRLRSNSRKCTTIVRGYRRDWAI